MSPTNDERQTTFQYPDVWEDDTKMTALFSPFRHKATNPAAWDSKMKFWENLIHQHCVHSSLPTFSLSSLKKNFLRKGKVPACLDTVVNEFLRQKSLVPTELYASYSLCPESLMTWALRSIVTNPLQWTLKKVTSSFAAKADPELINYTYVPAAKILGEDLLKNLPAEMKGRLIEIKQLVTLNLVKDENSALVILKSLIEEKKAAVDIIPPFTVIKFIKDDEKSAIILDLDRGVYHLGKKEKLLEENIESLEAEKEAAFNEVKSCLKAGRKQMAKSWLRRKHELEKYIEKRASALENIRTLSDRLKQTESDNMVLDAYREGIAALKNTFKTTELTEDKAEATMDELSEVLDVHKDIEDTLSRSLDQSADYELEEELAELLADSGPAEPPGNPGKSVTIDFPDTPKTDVTDLEERLRALSS